MQTTKYRSKSELYEYEADLIVTNVPVDYFNNDTDALNYYEANKNSTAWKKRNQEISDNFNPQMLGEMFYCLRCRRLEDGAHRRIIAKEKGIKAVNVRIGSDCYKNYVKAGRFLRGDSTFIETLSKLIYENPKRHKLDKKWLLVSALDKWPFILKHVDFRGKSFLDVGCNVGYSVFRAWSLMASKSTGYEIREDALRVAWKFLKENLETTRSNDGDKLNINRTWLEYLCVEADILSCMGLLHYFTIDDYESRINKLMKFCKDTLILEIRIRKNDKSVKLTVGSGGQTLPTEGWLYSKLKNNGFQIFAIHDREKDRATWIAKRRHN